MCHHCITDSVKERMLNRRNFFKVASVAGISAATITGVPSNPFAGQTQKFSKFEDMTHTLTENFPTYFGQQQFFMKPLFNWKEHKFNLNELRVNEHTGTHIDAPLHFSKDGLSVDKIPVNSLIVPLVVIDIRERASKKADTQITPDDIKKWMKKNGNLPKNCCVAMNSGWSKYVKTDKFRNADDSQKMHFPGFHAEAAKMLLEKSVAGIAVDTLSLDYGISADFATHYAWLSQGRWGLECIANLDSVPAKGATLVVGAPKHENGTGGPSRVFTLI